MVRASSSSREWRDEGFVSVEYMLAVGFSLLFLVMMTNIVVVQFGRGIVRAAVDEGARAGALVADGPVERCDQRAKQTLENMGEIGQSVQISCSIVGDEVHAVATARFAPWLPWMPEMTENATAVSRKEQAPT